MPTSHLNETEMVTTCGQYHPKQFQSFYTSFWVFVVENMRLLSKEHSHTHMLTQWQSHLCLTKRMMVCSSFAIFNDFLAHGPKVTTYEFLLSVDSFEWMKSSWSIIKNVRYLKIVCCIVSFFHLLYRRNKVKTKVNGCPNENGLRNRFISIASSQNIQNIF